jgi:hypothetical protein
MIDPRNGQCFFPRSDFRHGSFVALFTQRPSPHG